VVHPTRMKEASEEYMNLYGYKGEGRGVLAVFSVDDWWEDNEVHVVFDKPIHGTNGFLY
jgi:hypothetical protein